MSGTTIDIIPTNIQFSKISGIPVEYSVVNYWSGPVIIYPSAASGRSGIPVEYSVVNYWRRAGIIYPPTASGSSCIFTKSSVADAWGGGVIIHSSPLQTGYISTKGSVSDT